MLGTDDGVGFSVGINVGVIVGAGERLSVGGRGDEVGVTVTSSVGNLVGIGVVEDAGELVGLGVEVRLNVGIAVGVAAFRVGVAVKTGVVVGDELSGGTGEGDANSVCVCVGISVGEELVTGMVVEISVGETVTAFDSVGFVLLSSEALFFAREQPERNVNTRNKTIKCINVL